MTTLYDSFQGVRGTSIWIAKQFISSAIRFATLVSRTFELIGLKLFGFRNDGFSRISLVSWAQSFRVHDHGFHVSDSRILSIRMRMHQIHVFGTEAGLAMLDRLDQLSTGTRRVVGDNRFP